MILDPQIPGGRISSDKSWFLQVRTSWVRVSLKEQFPAIIIQNTVQIWIKWDLYTNHLNTKNIWISNFFSSDYKQHLLKWSVYVLMPYVLDQQFKFQTSTKKTRWRPFVWYSDAIQIPFDIQTLYRPFQYQTSLVFRSPLCRTCSIFKW